MIARLLPCYLPELAVAAFEVAEAMLDSSEPNFDTNAPSSEKIEPTTGNAAFADFWAFASSFEDVDIVFDTFTFPSSPSKELETELMVPLLLLSDLNRFPMLDDMPLSISFRPEVFIDALILMFMLFDEEKAIDPISTATDNATTNAIPTLAIP